MPLPVAASLSTATGMTADQSLKLYPPHGMKPARLGPWAREREAVEEVAFLGEGGSFVRKRLKTPKKRENCEEHDFLKENRSKELVLLRALLVLAKKGKFGADPPKKEMKKK